MEQGILLMTSADPAEYKEARTLLLGAASEGDAVPLQQCSAGVFAVW